MEWRRVAAAWGPVLGWGADLVVGDPRRGHPVALFGAAAERVERSLWRDGRLTGVVFAALLVGVPAAAAARLPRWVLPVLVWAAVGGRSLARAAEGVAEAVERGDLGAARAALPTLVGRDPSALDAEGICRAVCESVAENTADAVVGPLLWAAAAGPAGVVAYRCANTLDAMVGHRSPRYARFGWASARLDDVLGWVPARVVGLLAAGCAPVVGGDTGGALQTWRRDAPRHPSPNAGVCEAAFAGALGLTLGGEVRYGDRVEVRGPLGVGRHPGPADIRRAVRLSQTVSAATAVLAACARVGRRRGPTVRTGRPILRTSAYGIAR